VQTCKAGSRPDASGWSGQIKKSKNAK